MPFLVTREQPHGEKLYIQKQNDGEYLWIANKAKATRFDDAEAEEVAGQINDYSSMKAEIIGAGRAEPVPEQIAA